MSPGVVLEISPSDGCSIFMVVGGTLSGDLHKGFQFMVTHQIPLHCLATIQRRKQRLALGLVVWTERVGSQADIPASIITASVMHLLPGFKKKKRFLIFFFGLGS